MRPQTITSNSYINIVSEENFIHVKKDLHHIFIKTNIVYIRTIPYHIDPLVLIPFTSS